MEEVGAPMIGGDRGDDDGMMGMGRRQKSDVSSREDSAERLDRVESMSKLDQAYNQARDKKKKSKSAV